MNRKEAAVYLTGRSGNSYSKGMLEQKASRGTGPKYDIVDGQASYTPENLDTWLDQVTETPEQFKERRRLAREAAKARRSAAASSSRASTSIAAQAGKACRQRLRPGDAAATG
jgi:hypothetical protein